MTARSRQALPANPIAHPGRAWLTPVVLSLGVLGVAGCVLGPDPAGFDEEVESFTAQGGYRPERTRATTTLREVWQHDRSELDIVYTVPDEAGRFPLVLYFPGLGEDATAGASWRLAWAAAGYAVLSAQPASLVHAIGSAEPLNAGDLRALARRQFAPSALRRRVEHAVWAVAELQRRARTELSYARADAAHLAVAGFDLGAQTAAALSGEGGDEAVAAAMTPQAAILLSPYVSLASGQPGAGFASVRLPLLAVTATEDDDPYGLAFASLRQAAWNALPGGEQFGLVLQGGSHLLLSGADADQYLQRRSRAREAAMGSGGPAGMSGGQGVMPVPSSGYGGGGTDFGLPRRNPKADARQIAAVRSVTTAFLDATLRNSSEARRWLDNGARSWLGQLATLKRK
ncbi:alpha/beta hydrolase [Methylotetracoccus oryzae]|uniref:hypothetical protein n=1 Tax=Methylotetracoccus oryzae TaxID=1919059 RepID=UPI00111A3C35|nr:hypothetical protein [Methylotetracoccus oryzae]